MLHAQRVPDDVDNVKSAFLSRVSENVRDAGNPPPELNIQDVNLYLRVSVHWLL